MKINQIIISENKVPLELDGMNEQGILGFLTGKPQKKPLRRDPYADRLELARRERNAQSLYFKNLLTKFNSGDSLSEHEKRDLGRWLATQPGNLRAKQELEKYAGSNNQQGVAEGSEQVYNIVAVDKGNAMAKPKKLTYKAGSIEEVFDALAANDWYPLEINGVEVINGKHLKQGVAEGSLNEFAPDGFNGGDDDEGFSPEMAKMAQEDGFTKGASLADGATLERAMKIQHWDQHDGGMYKQYFAKGFKAGRMDKIKFNNKQYNLNLKLMKDGSIRHGEQGVAEGEGRFAGDTHIDVGGATMKMIQVGDIVKYLGQKAEVVALSKDRKRAQITIERGMGGITQDVNTNDLKQLGQGVAEGLNDTQKKIEDTINKLEDRLKHAKSDEQWDRISARIERLQAGLKRSKQGVAEGEGRNSRAYRADGGANDERHDLDPTDWYVVKNGKMFAAAVYPNQTQQAISLGYSRTKAEAKAKAGSQGMTEEWSKKYKSSINCSHPKGFSQKAHCAGKKKHNESVDNIIEMTCPDCGMCQTHGDHSKDNLHEACWKGYHKEGMKTMFGKQYPDCRKNKKKKVSENVIESTETDQVDENLRDWFKDKWVRFGPDGKIRGDCARGSESEGKPKCLPQSKAHSLGKEGRASAASRKRREDPNANRSGKAINVSTKGKQK